MKRMVSIALAVALVTSIATTQAWAGPKCCAKSKAAKAASCSASKSACDKLGDFPTMISMVGDEKFECPVSAEKAAEKSGAKVVYIVAEEKYDCRQKATLAFAEASEEYVKKFTSIACVKDGKVIYCDSASGSSCSKAKTVSAEASGCSKARKALVSGEKPGCCKSKGKLASAEKSCCSKSKAAVLAKATCGASCKGAKFLVLGRTFDKYDDAVKVRDAAQAEIKKVKMTYVVDGTKVDCASKVCPVAKKEGKVKFVVGDTQSGCEMTARATLARAQYEAARKVTTDQLATL